MIFCPNRKLNFEESSVPAGSPADDVLLGRWSDGRLGTFHGRRTGERGYGGTVFGSEAIAALGGFGGYPSLVAQIVVFFRHAFRPSILLQCWKSTFSWKRSMKASVRAERRFACRTCWRRPGARPGRFSSAGFHDLRIWLIHAYHLRSRMNVVVSDRLDIILNRPEIEGISLRDVIVGIADGVGLRRPLRPSSAPISELGLFVWRSTATK